MSCAKYWRCSQSRSPRERAAKASRTESSIGSATFNPPRVSTGSHHHRGRPAGPSRTSTNQIGPETRALAGLRGYVAKHPDNPGAPAPPAASNPVRLGNAIRGGACGQSGSDVVLVGESAENLSAVDPVPGEVDHLWWLSLGLSWCEPPARIVSRDADHELADRGCRGWPSGTPAAGVVPFACDLPPVPGEQRRRGHREHLTHRRRGPAWTVRRATAGRPAGSGPG